MKAIKFLSMLMLVMAMPVLMSCGDDEEEPLESVILGKWHSYNAQVSNGYNKITVDVNPNGEYASFYLEVNFLSNKTAIVKGWKESEDGQAMYWGAEETYVYSISGNDLNMIAPDGEKVGAKYYPKDGNIIWTMLVKDPNTGGKITGSIYFKK